MFDSSRIYFGAIPPPLDVAFYQLLVWSCRPIVPPSISNNRINGITRRHVFECITPSKHICDS